MSGVIDYAPIFAADQKQKADILRLLGFDTVISLRPMDIDVEEIESWCNQILGNKVTISLYNKNTGKGSWHRLLIEKRRYDFFFRSQDDAALFRLTWC